MIELTINGVSVTHRVNRFSDGAVGVNLVGVSPARVGNACITVRSEGKLNDEFFEIASLVDIIRRINPRAVITLYMPFTPYARQDRCMVRHDAFSLKVFANLLNSLELDKVVVLDSHSDVAPALINNCINIPQDFVLRNNRTEIECWADAIVCPDAGAAKKINKAAHALRLDPNATIYLEKIRDTSTGAITSTKITSDTDAVVGSSCLLVDDLCDGGATFIGAAEALLDAGAKRVGLFVTHGIFSRGVDRLIDNGIDHIWTTNSFVNPEASAHKDVSVLSANKVFVDYF